MSLANPSQPRYSVSALVKATGDGFSSPTRKRRTSAPMTFVGAFFVPATLCYGGCVREALAPAGFLFPRSANPRTAATQNRLAAIRGSSNSEKGATPMANYAPNTPSFSTRNPHTALAWYQSGRSIRIQALNLTDWVRHVRALAALEVVGGAQ